MGFEDRQYYREGGSGFAGGPISILGFTAPFGTWFGVRVRLGFWMLLSILFTVISYGRTGNLGMLAVHIALFIAAVLLHEFGRRFAARAVGGMHEEFILWPPGGMTQPQIPERPGTMFLTYSAGILTNVLLAVLCAVGLRLMGMLPGLGISEVLGSLGGAAVAAGGNMLATALSLFMLLNIGVALVAILPYYWFDGGWLWESVIWRFTYRRQAINIVCIVGMIIAAPMTVLALMAGFGGIMMALFWGLLFYSAYSRRKQLAYEYPNDFDAEIAQSASYREPPAVRRRRPGKLARWMTQRKVAKEQSEQAEVDRILEKVAQHGMHSLTNGEKKTLQRASERLREERRA